MEALKINGIDISLGYLISLFNKQKDSLIIDHLVNCRFDGFWLTSCNSWNNNIKAEYNQNFVLCVDNKEIFITNFDLMGKQDKFYKFQDINTFIDLKKAVKKFIKLIIKNK